MTSTAYDIAQYITGRFAGLSAYDPTTINGRTEGVLVEQEPNPTAYPMENYEETRVDVTVRATGRGPRGSSRAYEEALRIYQGMKLLLDIEINGTQYDRIQALTSPYELYGGADYSLWKIVFNIERATE